MGQQHPGSTVLVLSPGWAGSYSTTYDRVLLEAGQDVAKLTPDPVQGAQNFVDQLNTPIFPWTAFTIGLVFAVSGAAVVTRLLQRRAARPEKHSSAAENWATRRLPLRNGPLWQFHKITIRSHLRKYKHVIFSARFFCDKRDVRFNCRHCY